MARQALEDVFNTDASDGTVEQLNYYLLGAVVLIALLRAYGTIIQTNNSMISLIDVTYLYRVWRTINMKKENVDQCCLSQGLGWRQAGDTKAHYGTIVQESVETYSAWELRVIQLSSSVLT